MIFILVECPVLNCSCFESKSPLRSDLNYPLCANNQTWNKKGFKTLVYIRFNLILVQQINKFQ